MRGDGGVADDNEEGGGGDKTPPDAGGTAEGEEFGEGVVDAIPLTNPPSITEYTN